MLVAVQQPQAQVFVGEQPGVLVVQLPTSGAVTLTPAERLAASGIWYGTQEEYDALDPALMKSLEDWLTSGTGYFEFHILPSTVAVLADNGASAATSDAAALVGVLAADAGTSAATAAAAELVAAGAIGADNGTSAATGTTAEMIGVVAAQDGTGAAAGTAADLTAADALAAADGVSAATSDAAALIGALAVDAGTSAATSGAAALVGALAVDAGTSTATGGAAELGAVASGIAYVGAGTFGGMPGWVGDATPTYLPAGLQAGNLMLVVGTVFDVITTAGSSTGWTFVVPPYPDWIGLSIAWKIAGSGETAPSVSASWYDGETSSAGFGVRVFAFSGATSVDTHAEKSVTGTSLTGSQLTTSTNDEMILLVGANNAAARTYSTPGGSIDAIVASSASYTSLFVGYKTTPSNTAGLQAAPTAAVNTSTTVLLSTLALKS